MKQCPLIFIHSKQKHKNIVSVIGTCTDTRQPYVISDYVEGESLKDVLLKDDHYLTWPRRLKMVRTVNTAVSF